MNINVRAGILVALIFSFLGCSSQAPSLGTDLDISPNFENLLIVKHNPLGSAIKELNLKTGEISDIANIENMICLRPKYSKDGNNIYFIATDQNWKETSLYKYSITEKSSKKIFEMDNFIGSYDISSNDEIYFCTASEFKNYSPFASAAFHGFNFFKYDLNTKEVTLQIQLDSYSMGYLSFKDDSEHLYANIWGSRNKEFNHIDGMCLINLKTMKIDSVHIKNNPRQPVKVLCNIFPTSDKDFILFTAPYELYGYKFSDSQVMDIVTVEMKAELEGMFIYSPRLDITQNCVYFIVGHQKGENAVYKIDLKSRKFEKVFSLNAIKSNTSKKKRK